MKVVFADKVFLFGLMYFFLFALVVANGRSTSYRLCRAIVKWTQFAYFFNVNRLTIFKL